jgi:hypothetical protein
MRKPLYEDPESNIAAMLFVIEQFDEPERSVWQGLTVCEFNIGYNCGSKPWAFNQGLSNALLQRMTKVGASLRFTLYPPESLTEQSQQTQSSESLIEDTAVFSLMRHSSSSEQTSYADAWDLLNSLLS